MTRRRLSKTAADYRDPSPMPGQRCGNCRHRRPQLRGPVLCAVVEGAIRPSAWCAFWAGGAPPV